MWHCVAGRVVILVVVVVVVVAAAAVAVADNNQELLDPGDGFPRIQNFRYHSPSDRVSHPRKLESSSVPLWEPEM